MITVSHQDPAVRAHAFTVLQMMNELCTSLTYASLLTDDGFEVVHIPDGDIDGGRFASMSSSVQALSEAVTRELRIGSSQYVIIASQVGHVIQLRVPGHSLVLAALFDDDETLGKALSISRMSAERMSSLLTAEVDSAVDAAAMSPAPPLVLPPPPPQPRPLYSGHR